LEGGKDAALKGRRYVRRGAEGMAGRGGNEQDGALKGRGYD